MSYYLDILVNGMMFHETQPLPPEFDYLTLLHYLGGYANPRDKITRLLRSGEIIRVKKGLYVRGRAYASEPFSKEVLANLIYGPSYISLESALSFYNLIPERVETVTSVTCLRNKNFATPVGAFSYRYLALHKYRVGVTQLALDTKRNIIIATKEKALADKLYFSNHSRIDSMKALQELLFDDLRVDQSALRRLRKNRIREIGKTLHLPVLDLLSQYLEGSA